MAVNPALYQELARALSRPSKAYRAASAALEVPEDAVKGYAQGTDLADKFSTRRLANQTLEQALGGNVPDIAAPYRNLTVKQFEPTAKLLLGLGALERGQREGLPKQKETWNDEQTQAIYSGDPARISKAFNGQVPPNAATAGMAPVREAHKESQFVRGHEAAEGAKVGENISRVGQLKTMVAQLEPMVTQNHPIPGLGNVGGAIYSATGGVGTPQMARSADINNIAAPLSAALNYELTKRFNSGESQLIQKAIAPNGNDQPDYGLSKLKKMKALIGAMESGNDLAVRNIASSITGGKIQTNAPITTGLNMDSNPDAQNKDPLGIF